MSRLDTSARLSAIDRFLPVWIVAAMALGLLVGHTWPGVGATLYAVKVAGVSLPIAFGLFWMMYPVLAKVRYGKLGGVRARGKLFVTSLAFNWLLGPLLMFVLAWVLLPDLPHYRTGLILIGLARCIAMVLIWNMLARGSNEVAALLVALNSVFQILFYSVLGWFYLTVVPTWLGSDASEFHVSMLAIAKSVLLFLGLPLGSRCGDARTARPVEGRDLVRAKVPSPHRPGCTARSFVHHRSHVRDARGTRLSGPRSTWCASPSPWSSTSS